MRMVQPFLNAAARYGALCLLVNVGFVTSAPAVSVADVLAAHAVLQVPEGMDEAAWRSRRAAQEPAMQRAYAVLATAHAVEEAVIATHHVAMARYGVLLVCNLDEEAMPTFATLAERFVVEGAALHGLGVEEARPRLVQTDITEMLPIALLSWYRCPNP